jgi:hypothetical protein
LSPDQLRAFVAVMRELGVTRFTQGDVSIELGQLAPLPLSQIMATEPPPPLPGGNHAEQSDYEDRILYAATEGFPTEGDPS